MKELYTEFINLLTNDVNNGLLQLSDMVEVLRTEESQTDYRPIAYWYSEDPTIAARANPNLFTDDQEDLRNLCVLYTEDKHMLEEISVADCIAEMHSYLQ